MPLTPAWYPLRFHPQQSALWRTDARFVAACAGRGSGKTELARRRVVRFLPVRKPHSDPQYFYALPTREQAKRIAWGKIKELIPKDWLAKDGINETELKITTKFGSILYVFGMDKPQRAEGLQYDGGVIDESSDQKPLVFEKTFLPALSARNGWCWRIGVPKRFGVGGPSFKTFFDRGMKHESIIPDRPDLRIESYTWKSEDIVDPALIQFARQNLDDKDYNEQYGASWEDSGGRIFYAFDDVMNTDDSIAYQSNAPLCICSDFNVSPMAWCIGQRTEKEFLVFDEIWLRDTNTQATLDELWKRYSAHNGGWEFYGDATGRARKTCGNSAAQSDYLIIRADTRFKDAKVYYPKSNPSVVDRFASCNAMFKNQLNERRCRIHPRCKYLRKDLLQRAYVEGTREADDSGDIGHITDALGYALHRLFPIRYSFGEAPGVAPNGS